MQPDYANETLKNIQAIWNRPVCLTTVVEGQGKLIRFDGQELKEFTLGQQGPEPQQASGD